MKVDYKNLMQVRQAVHGPIIISHNTGCLYLSLAMSRHFLAYDFVALKRAVLLRSKRSFNHLSTLAADTAGKLDVLGHDGHALCVNGAQVGVFEKAHQIGLAGLLQRHYGRALEA